ncbi:MAG: squalene/phytoene synthase family protein [Phycisphaeraceae bacterium]|nr:squalene/phytoene synthase family protein [Phycisphaeraceae bacterium]
MSIDPSPILTERPPAPGAGSPAVPGLDAARRLASTHYENFHVLSRFVPAGLRDDFAAVYAFCRGADDIADDAPPTDEGRAQALAELARWHALVEEAHASARDERDAPPDDPIFGPLAETMRRRALDAAPFHDLLDAFEQDQRVTRYETWEQVLDYCARSANPVGRIVLAMIDSVAPLPSGGRGALSERDAMLRMSDAVCTALQLANFWQDVRRDLDERDRVYLPSVETGLDAQTLRRWKDTPDDASARVAYIRAMRPLVRRTREMFAQGEALPRMIPDADLSRVVRLFIAGGERTLDKIERIGCATLWSRPSLTKAEKAGILLRTRLAPGTTSNGNGEPVFVRVALEKCASVTRREARNFYYGLRLTPGRRRSALYAVYAWMRDADDDADEDDRAVPTREVAMARIERRRSRLRALVERDCLESAHASWVGLAWAMREFPVDAGDLFGLLEGLEEDANHAGYESRDGLERYCERVASTVGRVCVAIWGTVPGADAKGVREKATSRGVAFQLSNILRDIRRDFLAGRVYVPREDLARHGLSAQALAEWSKPDGCAALVRDLAAWARREFEASEGLEAMIDPACAPSMRAMTEIYSGVLGMLEREPMLAACEPRASLPAWRKVAIMLHARGGRA